MQILENTIQIQTKLIENEEGFSRLIINVCLGWWVQSVECFT